ncbi:thioredoxin, mitochondrial [Electrophorus electricus]|uniref:Thioredoxin, mitochondrial n=1 Tax=Electrophorus electricus TaxID=8005 RepID=A0A4W4HQD2_ELEEL|nr:thioredoxin, mitochondrial [Electrophorus electricus]
MAARLFARGVWAISVKESRSLSASALCSSSYSSSSSLSRALRPRCLLLPCGSPRGAPLCLHACRGVSFNVQDQHDFTERVIKSELPVLVDFHAQWCGPCKILSPRLEKAIAKQKGRVAMAKVDIDEHTDLAIEYGVSAVPTVIAMRGGDVIDQFVGIKDEDQLDSFVNKLIG